MGGQIVHDHDITGRQGRRQDLLHIGQEGRAVHGAIQDHRRRHAAQPEGADEGGGLPVSVWHRRPASLTTGRPAAQPGHLCRGAGLVDEDQAFRIKIGLEVKPSLSPPQNVRPLLLGGVRCFF